MAFLEVEKHPRIAAACDDTPCGRAFPDTQILQEVIAPDACEAILAEQEIGRASIRLSHKSGVWQSFDLTSTLLAVVAVADNAEDGRTYSFVLHASART